MSKITLAPNAAGTAIFTVAAPATSTDRTLTLPDVTGTLLSTTSDLGWGQTWQDVLASRAVSTSYQNLTSRPIQVAIITNGSTTRRYVEVSVDNSTWIKVGVDTGGESNTSFIVPINYYYRVNGATGLIAWAELR